MKPILTTIFLIGAVETVGATIAFAVLINALAVIATELRRQALIAALIAVQLIGLIATLGIAVAA